MRAEFKKEYGEDAVDDSGDDGFAVTDSEGLLGSNDDSSTFAYLPPASDEWRDEVCLFFTELYFVLEKKHFICFEIVKFCLCTQHMNVLHWSNMYTIVHMYDHFKDF